MTNRDRMLAVIRGEKTDQIPWAPRMDLWMIANRENDTLPDGLEPDLGIAQIAERLDVGCRAFRYDATLPARPEGRLTRGLGLDSHPDFAHRFELHDVTVDHEHDEENTVTTFHLPGGDLTTHWRLTQEMRSILEEKLKTW